MTPRPFLLTTVLCLWLTPGFAETNTVNLHLGPAAGADFQPGGFVSGVDLKVDVTRWSLGPIAPQLELFGVGGGDAKLLAQGSLFGAGVGLRARLLNDEKGYFIVPGQPRGNLWGNLWLDANFVISSGGPRFGLDAGLGYEFSPVDGFQIGPFAKFIFLNEPLLLFGLSFSFGAPHRAPPEYLAAHPPVSTIATEPQQAAPTPSTPVPAPPTPPSESPEADEQGTKM